MANGWFIIHKDRESSKRYDTGRIKAICEKHSFAHAVIICLKSFALQSIYNVSDGSREKKNDNEHEIWVFRTQLIRISTL